MDALQAITERRSVYPDQFISRPVSEEVLLKLLDAANCAPSHKKTYPWRFKVFYEDGLQALSTELGKLYTSTTPKEKFSEFKYKKVMQKPLQSAAVIAICMQRDPKERLPEWEEIAATAMAVQNLWLAATASDLGGYWSSPIAIIEKMDHYLGLSTNERCLGFFYLGYFDKNQQMVDRKDIDTKTTFIRSVK